MTHDCQKNASRTTGELRQALPRTVSVAMAEIAENVQEELLALAVGTACR